MIRAFVGAGGKTSLIKEYVSRFVNEGKKVFVTTSTHMFIEEETVLSDDAKVILDELNKTGFVMAGMRDGEKIKSLSYDTYLKVCESADEVLIEADGSKHFPLKYPRDSEPVIYDNVDEVVVVCGLHGLKKKAASAIHCFPQAKDKLEINEDDIIRAEDIQSLVKKGYLDNLREKYPYKTIKLHASSAVTMYEKAAKTLLESEKDVSLIKESWFETQPKLIVCGAGHVAFELVKMARYLDFNIKVIDDRAEFANEERFGEADEIICDSFNNFEDYLEDDAFYVVVTRGHLNDFECLKKILKRPYSYLGMIGSKLKVAKAFENLREEGFDEEKIESIYAPIGLPIKAETPAEIAVSILSQIILVKNENQTSRASRELLDNKEKGTLCVIINKTGSAPRGEGTMMFVTEDKVIDTIGGGAVEFSAIEDARNCNEVMIKEYHLDNEKSRELGMICGGSNTVLFIPIE